MKSLRKSDPTYADLNSEYERDKELMAELEKTEKKLREVERKYKDILQSRFWRYILPARKLVSTIKYGFRPQSNKVGPVEYVEPVANRNTSGQVTNNKGVTKQAAGLRKMKKQAVPEGTCKSAIVGRGAVSSNRPPDRPEEAQSLKELAKVALERYGLQDAWTDLLKKRPRRYLFRVSLSSGRNFILRIYQPPRIEQKLLHIERRLRSQLLWQEALRREMGLSVPEPVPAIDGQLTSRVSVEGLPRSHICTLLSCMPGNPKAAAEMSLADACMVGSYVARLHLHSERYSAPEDFVRQRYDWDNVLGDSRSLWREGRKFYSEGEMALFRTTAERIRRDLRTLGESSDVFGIIHCNLNEGNLIFHEGNVSAIDFDRCGWGYYLYDLATPLVSLEKSHGNRCGPLQDALLEGYQRVRLLLKSHVKYQDTFAAMRIMAKVDLHVSRGTLAQPHLPVNYMEKPGASQMG